VPRQSQTPCRLLLLASFGLVSEVLANLFQLMAQILDLVAQFVDGAFQLRSWRRHVVRRFRPLAMRQSLGVSRQRVGLVVQSCRPQVFDGDPQVVHAAL
jgi:hypothetical protein